MINIADISPYTTAILVFVFILNTWMNILILRKAGYSLWWLLVTFIPIANIIIIWVFAFSDWPNLRKNERD